MISQPLGEIERDKESELPILRGVLVFHENKNLRGDAPTLMIKVACPHCPAKFHFHGWPSESLDENLISHVRAHCLPFRKTGRAAHLKPDRFPITRETGYFVGLDPTLSGKNAKTLSRFHAAYARWQMAAPLRRPPRNRVMREG